MFSVYYLVTKLSYFSFSWLLPVMCYIGHKYKHDLSIHHLSLNLGMSQPSDIVDSRLTGFLSFHVPQIRFPLWLKRESPLLCLFLCWLYHGQKMSLGKTLCCSSQFHKLVSLFFPVPQRKVLWYTSCQQTNGILYWYMALPGSWQHAWLSLC